MTPCISVIMPVYNAEKTLADAVRAVLAQDMPDLELLLIDDGSTDGSGQIARTLAARDARIRLVSQPNKGICAARNAGLARAAGRYLAFCDDDDLFLPGALRRLYTLAEQTGADVVRGGYRLLRQRPDGGMSELPHPPGEPCRLEGTTRLYGPFLQNSGPQFVWNALYRRQAVEGICFDERCRSGLEDFVYNAAVYARVGLVVYDPTPVYRHHERVGSTSTCRSAEALQGRIDALAPWLEAEYRAACRWCGAKTLPAVWAERRAAAVTFLMHQLRDMRAAPAQRRRAWRALRAACRPYPSKLPGPGALGGKPWAALWLFRLHLQGLYELLPNKEDSL